jgi:hypothetical protein
MMDRADHQQAKFVTGLGVNDSYKQHPHDDREGRQRPTNAVTRGVAPRVGQRRFRTSQALG